MTTATFTQSAAPTLRWSEPVIVKTAIFVPTSREIKTMDDRGVVRVCKVDRLEITHARAMWKFIQQAIGAGWPMSFAANSGYSPDKWFCDVNVDMNTI